MVKVEIPDCKWSKAPELDAFNTSTVTTPGATGVAAEVTVVPAEEGNGRLGLQVQDQHLQQTND